MQRLAELEHHVVGDVDGQARSGACPPGVSRRCIHGGVGGVGSTPRTMRATNRSQPGVAVDRRVVGELHGVARGRRRPGPRRRRRVAEARRRWRGAYSRAMPRMREAVAAVGGDVDLDDLVVEAEQLDGVGRRARRRRGPSSASTMMPSWSSPRPSSRGGADHAVGDVAVGLARGDRERRRAARRRAARRRPGRRRRSCARRRRCPAGVPSVSLWPCCADVDLAPADRLAVLLRLRRRARAPGRRRAGR